MSITALFSGIFIVVVGGLADRLGRVKILMWRFVFSIVGSVLVGVAPSGALATPLTGATVSNFLLNVVAGMLLVSMMLVQVGGGLSAQEAGMLTLGYAIAIVAFIRVGEKLLQKFGARKPMIWGSLIVGFSVALLMPMRSSTSMFFEVLSLTYHSPITSPIYV